MAGMHWVGGGESRATEQRHRRAAGYVRRQDQTSTGDCNPLQTSTTKVCLGGGALAEFRGMPPLTLQHVARAAGVSVSTASRALRHSTLVAEKTAGRVRRTAAKLGFQLSPLVAAHMTYVRGTSQPGLKLNLAALTAFETARDWERHSSFVSFFRGMESRARQLGYGFDHIWMREPGLCPERIDAILHARGIRGAVLMPFPDGYGHPKLNWSRLAVATVGYSLTEPRLHWASSRHYQIASLALQELKQLGYRRIGLALPPLADRYADGAFLARTLLFQQEQCAPAERVTPLQHRDWNDWNAATFLSWYRQHQPDAILTMNSVCRDWLTGAGVRVPEDVGLAHLDLTSRLPDWSGINEHAEEVGVASLDLVIEQLNFNRLGVPAHPKAVLIDGHWVNGSTTRRLTR